MTTKSWTPKDQREAEDVSKDALALKLQDIQRDAAAKTVPWFLENMPAAYFRAVSENERLQHLNAITSLRNACQPELMLNSEDGKEYSYIREGEMGPGELAKILTSLADEVDGA